MVFRCTQKGRHLSSATIVTNGIGQSGLQSCPNFYRPESREQKVNLRDLEIAKEETTPVFRLIANGAAETGTLA